MNFLIQGGYEKIFKNKCLKKHEIQYAIMNRLKKREKQAHNNKWLQDRSDNSEHHNIWHS